MQPAQKLIVQIIPTNIVLMGEEEKEIYMPKYSGTVALIPGEVEVGSFYATPGSNGSLEVSLGNLTCSVSYSIRHG